MSRSFLTGLNLNKNELLNARIQNLSTAPANPVAGQIYYDTDTNQITVWNGTSWVSLAAGGDVTGQITAAIDALDTDDIEEGASNLYYTTARAKTDAAALLTSATLTNITITGNGSGLTITAENGVADSTTDNLTEGSTNKYFTDERAQDAVGNAVGTGLSYNDSTGAISPDLTYLVDKTTAQTLTNKTLTSPKINEDVALTATATELNVLDGITASTAELNTLDGITASTAELNILDGVTASASELNILDGATLTTTELNYVDGVTSAIQTQLDGKLDESGGTMTGAIAMGTNKITGLGTPTDAADAATKAYVDAVAEGLHVHESVRVATGANVSIANGLENGDTLSGVTLATGDRVLVKNQTTTSENGIYVVQLSGQALRALDFDTATEVDSGDFVFVTSGTYANTGWVQTSSPATIGTDPITFQQFSGAGTFTAGNGLTINGSEFNVGGTADRITVGADSVDIAATYVGQTSITTLGTITTGVWNGTDVAIADGGTGASTAADARANLGATTKYAANNTELTVTSGSVTWTVTHSLGTRDVTVQVFAVSDYSQVEVDVVRTSTSVVTLSWNASATVAADSYRVVIVG